MVTEHTIRYRNGRDWSLGGKVGGGMYGMGSFILELWITNVPLGSYCRSFTATAKVIVQQSVAAVARMVFDVLMFVVLVRRMMGVVTPVLLNQLSVKKVINDYSLC